MDTVLEIEEFFKNRADNLQEHLSIPVSEQAYYKRFQEAYAPLDQGVLTAQWRERLLARLLALSGTKGKLSAAQQASLNNSLGTLANTGASSADAAAALQNIQNTLGISGDAAAGALMQAGSDASLFDGNASIGAMLQGNVQSGYNTLQSKAVASNSLNIPSINSPASVSYTGAGPIAGVTSAKQPSANDLTLTRFASSFGGNSGSTPRVGSTTASVGHTSPNSSSGGQGIGHQVVNNLVQNIGNGGQGSTTAGNTTNHFLVNPNGNSVNRPTLSTTNTPTISSNTSTTSTTTSPKQVIDQAFKFNPLVSLGGDFAKDHADTLVKALVQSIGTDSTLASSPKTTPPKTGTSPYPDPFPTTSGAKAGDSFASGKAKEAIDNRIKTLEEVCKEDLQTKLKSSKVISENGKYDFSEMAKWVKNWSVNSINKTKETLKIKSTEERVKIATTEKADKVQGPLSKREIDDIKLATYRDEFALRTSHLNALLITAQTDCVFSGENSGMTREACNKLVEQKIYESHHCEQMFPRCNDFANVPSSQADKIPISDHLKIMTLIDTVEEFQNTYKKPDERAAVEGLRKERNKDLPPSEQSSPGADPAITLIQASPEFSNDNDADSALLNRYLRRRGNSEIGTILSKCFDKNTSWASKVRDMELQLRNTIAKKCMGDDAADPNRIISLSHNTLGEFRIYFGDNKDDVTIQDLSNKALPITQDTCQKTSNKEYKLSNSDTIPDSEINLFPDYFGIKSEPNINPEKCEQLKIKHRRLLVLSTKIFEHCKAHNSPITLPPAPSKH